MGIRFAFGGRKLCGFSSEGEERNSRGWEAQVRVYYSQPGQPGSLMAFQRAENGLSPGQHIPGVSALAAKSHPEHASMHPGLVAR